MARFALLYNGQVPSVVDGGNWMPALPLVNLLDDDLAKVARSANATPAATQFDIDLGAVKTLGGFAIGPGNLSPGATWEMKWFSDAARTEVTYTTGPQTIAGSVIDWTDENAWLAWRHPGFWSGVADKSALREVPQCIYHVVPADLEAMTTQQHLRFLVENPGNPNGYIDFGHLLLGTAMRPSLNYEDNELNLVPLTSVEESLGGRRDYWERGGQRRAYRVTFKNLQLAEIFGDAMSVALRSGISRIVFVVPDPDDTVHGSRRSFFATMTRSPPLAQAKAGRGSVSFDFEEVL